jgi:NADH dehydrogenase (ubiquinone) 1 alpha/beta subcomplex 1
MFRSAVLATSRAAARPVCWRQAAIARPLNLRTPLFQSKNQLWFQAARCYSASAGLTKEEVQGRIMDLLKNFDKVRVPLTDAREFCTDFGSQVTDASKVHIIHDEEPDHF